ncbi:ARHGAP17 [Cordylochernes scorpioides]|uniref:ARHGAP17 n=1 Tax=Cordylochernes scorpioides TaxID=51811 RepID=A0ABY6LI71_9ARAC|nr:ARHGAP17 [Cordylochernes scorpioides]
MGGRMWWCPLIACITKDSVLSRAEKSEVLSEELQNVEKRVELIKQVCQTVFKKMTAFLSSVSRNETSVEKKMKKMPEVVLSTAMLELSQTLKEDSILGGIDSSQLSQQSDNTVDVGSYVLGECSQFQDCLAKIKLSFELEAEAQVLQPIATILEICIIGPTFTYWLVVGGPPQHCQDQEAAQQTEAGHGLCTHQSGDVKVCECGATLPAADRHCTGLRGQQGGAAEGGDGGGFQQGGPDQVHVVQAMIIMMGRSRQLLLLQIGEKRFIKDALLVPPYHLSVQDCLAAEMLALVSREPEISELIRLWYRLQASYHRDVLDILECSLPPLEAALEKCPQKPVFGLHLSQHLSTSDRQIAWVLEACVCFLLEWGLCEEIEKAIKVMWSQGLFRIAGGSSKVKKLKVRWLVVGACSHCGMVQNSFDCGLVDMTDYLKDPHAVAGVLKSYLRELPDPLLTPELYDEWLAATKVPDSNDRLQALWTVLHKLPAPNFQNLRSSANCLLSYWICIVDSFYVDSFYVQRCRGGSTVQWEASTETDVSRYLVKFLSKLAANNDVNKMSSQNLAIVLAPNLIWAPKEDINTPLGLVETLISYCNWFFPEEVEFYQTLSPGWLDHHKPTNGELEIDLSSDSRVVHKPHKKPAPPAPQPEPLEQPPAYATLERPEKPERTSIQVKSSTENLAVGYKPAVPERPIPYSTMSLERPVKVRGGNKGDRAEVRLSVIERPSVPPPARPADPPVPSGIALSSTLSFVDESDPEEDIPVSDRWDFLHNSGGHIPPDRPPRSHEEPPKPRARTVPPVPPPVKPKPLPSPTTESPPTQC